MNFYYFTVGEKLLNANHWTKILGVKFKMNRIEHFSTYKNWTVEMILNNKAAIYMGVKSDMCLHEILSRSQPQKPCLISQFCREMMLDKFRMDQGYLLTHRFDNIFSLSILNMDM